MSWHNHFCFRALDEAETLAETHKQKLPESLEKDDLLSFNMLAEFDVLRSHAPLLYHVVAGAMNLKQNQLQVIVVQI